MIDDEEITEADDYDPDTNKILNDVCYVIELAMNEMATSAQPLEAVMWFGTYFNISLYDKSTQIRHNQLHGTCASRISIIKPIMKKMKRDFPEDNHTHGYYGWLITLDELQELHDLLKKHIQAPFV